MVLYVPKQNKLVILMLTEHLVAKCANKENKFKPQKILDYNDTKGGVDNIDQMVSHFLCQRSTQQWPMAFFYCLLGLAAKISFVMFFECSGSKPERSSFLEALAMQLVQEYAGSRATNLPSHVLCNNQLVTGKTEKAVHKRGKCCICKITYQGICTNCSKQVCVEHCTRVCLCFECSGKNDTIGKN